MTSKLRPNAIVRFREHFGDLICVLVESMCDQDDPRLGPCAAWWKVIVIRPGSMLGQLGTFRVGTTHDIAFYPDDLERAEVLS